MALGGVTVSRATLHNEDEIRRLGLKIGDAVVVERGGEVIPKVVRVEKDQRKPHAHLTDPAVPSNVRSARDRMVREEGEVASRCVNADCPAKAEGIHPALCRAESHGH